MSSSIAPLLFFNNKNGKYLDYAGGYRTLCRLMRDIGFDFCTTDAYCTNLFARDFVCNPERTDEFVGVTAIEVLEHIHNPMDFFENISQFVSQSGIIVFSTLRYEGEPPKKDWWYYSFDTGQHISFYTKKTLETLAKKLNMHLLFTGSLHMFSRKRSSALFFRLLLGRLNVFAAALVRRSMHSRLNDDYLLACKKQKESSHKF